jgi:mannose-1-phosphate guanylyltransferase
LDWQKRLVVCCGTEDAGHLGAKARKVTRNGETSIQRPHFKIVDLGAVSPVRRPVQKNCCGREQQQYFARQEKRMAILDRHENIWASVLAGGEGTRLSTLTHALHGWDMPKQFAALWGGQTLLERTLDRTVAIVPLQKTVVVAPDSCKSLVEEQLRDYFGIKVVYQPNNRGTGAGVLLPLVHVLARDPGARIVIFPSDHHVEREVPFRDAIRRAMMAMDFTPSRTALVGATADSAATDLGWIDCNINHGPLTVRAWGVNAFVEKPDATTAVELLRKGALWNTMIIATRGQSLLDMADRHIPEVCRIFKTYRELIGHRGADDFLREIYPRLPVTDFCRDVLQPEKGLAVTPMIDTGWHDCGTPERLFRAMEPSQEGPRLLARIERQGPYFDDISAAVWRKLETHRVN